MAIERSTVRSYDGRGGSTQLTLDPARDLTAVGPDHPWTGIRFTASWNSGTTLKPVLVAPRPGCGGRRRASQDHGVWRHPLRCERLGLDATEADVPTFLETR